MKEQCITIGTIDLSSAININKKLYKIKLGRKLENTEVKLYGREGPVPHFHLECEKEAFFCCPCIFVPLYFNHDIKISKLEDYQLLILDNWLREINPDTKHAIRDNETRWQTIARLFGDMNKTYKNEYFDPYTFPQPDYTKMVNMRSNK